MSLSLENKHAIVCGSSDGIGKASALKMAQQGCEITLVARDKVKLDAVLSVLNDEQGQVHQIICSDFNDPDNLKKDVASYLRLLDKPVDILVNNSGGPQGGPLIEADESEFRIAFERLLICNQIMAKAVFPGMKKKGSGRIINIISASVNQVIPGLGVSNTIRGSVAQWGKTLAIELGQYGICVNNILPGYTATSRLDQLVVAKADSSGLAPDRIRSSWANKTSLLRLGTPEEIAATVAFLASSESSYITGHNLSVDGGRFGA